MPQDLGVGKCVRALADLLAQLQTDVKPMRQQYLAVHSLASGDDALLMILVGRNNVCAKLRQWIAELAA